MKWQTKNNKPYFSMALFALLVLATLALVLVGSRVYQTLVQGQNQNSNGRAVHAYLYSQLRGADRTNGVVLGEGPQGQALLLQENIDGTVYETRIYLYNSNLMEEYAVQGTLFDPDKAQAVAKAQQFEIEIIKDLIKINTDEGLLYMALRSAGGTAP